MKNIFLLSFFAILSLNVFAQWEWDDVYYAPKKTKKAKVAVEAGYFERQIKESSGASLVVSDTISNLLELPNGIFEVEVDGYSINFDNEELGSITNIYNLKDGYYTIYVDDDSIVIKSYKKDIAVFAPTFDIYQWGMYDYSWGWSSFHNLHAFNPSLRWWYWGAPDYLYFGLYSYYNYFYWNSPWIYWSPSLLYMGTPWWSGGSGKSYSNNYYRLNSNRNQAYSTNISNRNVSRINPDTYRGRSFSNSIDRRYSTNSRGTYNERNNTYSIERRTTDRNRQTTRNDSYNNSSRQQTRSYDRNSNSSTRNNNSSRSTSNTSRSSSISSSRSSSVSSGSSSRGGGSSSSSSSSRGSSNGSRR